MTRIRISFLLLICSVGSIFGQEIYRLSPGEAVELAFRNNLSLESARIELSNKQRAADLVWNQFLPSITATGTLIRDNNASTVSGMAPVTELPLNNIFSMINPLFPSTPEIYGVVPYSVDAPQWHINGTISASLDFSFAMIAGIQTVKSNYQAGLVTYEKARLQMERDIRKTYNQILLLQENVVLLNDNYASAQRQAATAEANYRAGMVPRLTWLQAQVQVENLRPTVLDLENSLKALQASFAFTLGLPYDTVFELEPLLDEAFHIPLDLAQLITQAASGKPDIVELQRNITVLQNTRKATALQLYTPFLRLSWSFSSTFIKDPWKDGWFEKDNWNNGGNFSITLGYSLNTLFPFTKEGQNLVTLDNQIRSLNIGLAQLIAGTELEIYTKINSLQKTQAAAEVQRSAIELAELSYSLTEEAYNAGLQDLQSVQNSSLALSQARLQLLTQQFSYINDLIDLEYAVGVPFGTLSTFK